MWGKGFGECESAEDVRRGTSGGDAEHCVQRSEFQRIQLGLGSVRIVLLALGGFAERSVAAGDQANDALRLGLKRRRALAGVQHAQSPAGSRAEVDQSPAREESRLDGLD